MTVNEPPVTLSIVFDQSTTVLWKALTDPTEMRCWFFENIPDFKAEVGFETSFVVQSGGRDFDHQWKVTKADMHKHLFYNWRYEGFEGDAEVRFNVKKQGEGSLLFFEIIVLRDFQKGIPEFERAACEEGWNYFLKGRLKEYMNNLTN